MDQYFLIIALVSSLILYRSFSLGTILIFFLAPKSKRRHLNHSSEVLPFFHH